MARVTFSMSDPVVFMVRDATETVELFGDDFLKEYGVEIPDELLKEYQDAYQTFWKSQMNLEKYYKQGK